MESRTVRGLRTTVTEAVAATRAADADQLDACVARLAAGDAGQVAVLLGGMVRSLLEDTHPGGLTGEDALEVLQRCLTRGAGWFPAPDPNALVLVLAGALGTYDPSDATADSAAPSDPDDTRDDAPSAAAVGWPALVRHAFLVLAELLDGASVEPVLVSSLSEIRRAETVELP